MGLLSDKERSEFRMSISSKKLPELKKIFNRLTLERTNEQLSDNTRGKAAEKAAMVEWEIKLRKGGGCSG